MAPLLAEKHTPSSAPAGRRPRSRRTGQNRHGSWAAATGDPLQRHRSALQPRNSSAALTASRLAARLARQHGDSPGAVVGPRPRGRLPLLDASAPSKGSSTPVATETSRWPPAAEAEISSYGSRRPRTLRRNRRRSRRHRLVRRTLTVPADRNVHVAEIVGFPPSRPSPTSKDTGREASTTGCVRQASAGHLLASWPRAKPATLLIPLALPHVVARHAEPLTYSGSNRSHVHKRLAGYRWTV